MCVESTGNQKSTSTSAMMKNCSEHLREEITVLRPHLLITQGGHPRDTVISLFPALRFRRRFDGESVWARSEVWGGEGFVVLTTPHAARKKGWRWKRGSLP